MELQLANQIAFDNPALYRICVRGLLEESWAERMEMSISWIRQENGPTITILEGELRDQAALAGILHTLYNLHLSLLSLECLSGP
jgi:hypothetical protein